MPPIIAPANPPVNIFILPALVRFHAVADILAYEQYQYHLVHQDMVAEGLLEAIPLLLPLDAEDDDFEPEVIPGKPLSEIILEDRR